MKVAIKETTKVKMMHKSQDDSQKPSLGELLKFTLVGKKGRKKEGYQAEVKSGIWVIYSLNFPITQAKKTSLILKVEFCLH